MAVNNAKAVGPPRECDKALIQKVDKVLVPTENTLMDLINNDKDLRYANCSHQNYSHSMSVFAGVGALEDLSKARIYPKLNSEKPKALSEQILELEVMISVKTLQAMHR